MSEDTPPDDFVFCKDPAGNLKFVGDFETLYKTDVDPWGQFGKDSDMAAYYAHSRKRLSATLAGLKVASVVEVGCGLGMVTEEIQGLPSVKRAVGIDISPTAIEKASVKYPQCEFLVGDITAFSRPADWREVDAVIINQMLWYIVKSFDNVLINGRALLRDGGYLIIAQAFFRHGTQRYGQDVFDGFGGLVERLTQQGACGDGGNLEFVSANLTRDENAHYDDGHVLLRRA
jgi:SAM-dependent methyltransferase